MLYLSLLIHPISTLAGVMSLFHIHIPYVARQAPAGLKHCKMFSLDLVQRGELRTQDNLRVSDYYQ